LTAKGERGVAGEGDGEPGGGGEALAGGDAVHEVVDVEAADDPDGEACDGPEEER